MVRPAPRPVRARCGSDVEDVPLDVPLDALDDDRDVGGNKGERENDRRDSDQDDGICARGQEHSGISNRQWELIREKVGSRYKTHSH